MIKSAYDKLHLYFIPEKYKGNELSFRRARIFINTTLITSLFSLFYVAICIHYGMKNPLYSVSVCSVLFVLFAWLFRWEVPMQVCVILYTSLAYISCLFEAYWDGGIHSSVLSWMSMVPVISLMLNNVRISIFWIVTTIISIIIIGFLAAHNYQFPEEVRKENQESFIVNSYAGLVLIIFIVAMVFEKEQSLALKKISEQSLLLAEEKRKTALYDISQELHDNIGQILTLVKINIHTAKLLQDQNLLLKLDDTLDLVSKAMKDVREISHNLNAENITDFDLIKASKSQADAIAHIGVYTIDFKISGTSYKLKPQTEFILFRVIQETLNNIIKHAQATAIHIFFNYNAKQFALTIADNGVGISNEKLLLDGQGIRTMRSRVEVVGGSFNITSQKFEGTIISITVPVAG